MIQVTVDMDKCQHYGQCCFEAEDIFQLDNDGKLSYQAQASDDRSPTSKALPTLPDAGHHLRAIMTPDQVVIVGAGLGGLRAAESLRGAGYDGHLVIVGDEPHLPYNRPPLSKEALAGGVVVEDLHFRRRSSIDDVEWRLGSAAISCDLEEGTVTLADGTVLPFGGLVIASGIRPRQLPIPGPTQGRYLLRNLMMRPNSECTRFGHHLVIMGAGFIGCEVAATARKLGAEVDVVALDEEPMLRPLGPTFGAAMRQHHENNGVRFHMGRTVQEFLGDDNVSNVQLDDGTEIRANVVSGSGRLCTKRRMARGE